MGYSYDEDDEEEYEESLTEEQAQRFVEWVMEHGHSKEDAYEGLAYIMGATVEQITNEQA